MEALGKNLKDAIFEQSSKFFHAGYYFKITLQLIEILAKLTFCLVLNFVLAASQKRSKIGDI